MADTVTMPKLGFDMAEGVLVRWVIAEGEAVTKGAVLAEIETDKATVEVESSFEGVVARHLVGQDAVVPVNMPIAIIAQPGEDISGLLAQGEVQREYPESKPASPLEVADKPENEISAVSVQASTSTGERIKASPLARRMAREDGIDLTSISGTGPGGRVVKKDIEKYLAVPTTQGGQATTTSLTKLRMAIARRMLESKTTVPHFYITYEYDVAAMVALRQQVNSSLSEDSNKISLNDFIVKAVALALRGFPNLNASFNSNEIIQHSTVNIGIAVAVDGGLMTVVCRDADRKSLRQIAGEVKGLVGRARQGKVRPDDIDGSTFSISNLGMYAVEQFVAIINPPEAAILAVGAAKEIPVVEDGQLVPGIRMKATISVDHRVSDGAEAAQFMQALAQYIEHPLRLLVE